MVLANHDLLPHLSPLGTDCGDGCVRPRTYTGRETSMTRKTPYTAGPTRYMPPVCRDFTMQPSLKLGSLFYYHKHKLTF